MRDQELVEGAQAIASDMQLPNGRQAKLAKVIDRHLPWFEAAQNRGLGWDDIIELLFVAGVRRRDGQRISRGHISSLIWRKRIGVSQHLVGVNKSLQVTARKGGQADLNKRARVVQPARLPTSPLSPEHMETAGHRQHMNLLRASDLGSSTPETTGRLSDLPTDKQKTLDFMRRSAWMRGKS